MRSRSAREALGGVALLALGVAAIAWLSTFPAGRIDRASDLYLLLAAAVAVASMAVVVWYVEPAYTLSAAIVLTPFAGNWPQLGVPGALSPDRLLLAGGIAAVLFRTPTMQTRPRIQFTGAHWALILAAVYAVASALSASTLFEREPLFKLIDAFGLMPFLVFLTAPFAFRTAHQRAVLLGAFVALGAYLGLTVLFETARLDALVFPKYILDPNYGIHAHRGRGPFADAVANGLALYTCAVACAIAVSSWSGRVARSSAIVIGLLCVVGSFMSLERSVWIGVVLGTAIAMLSTRGLRRYFVPVAVAVTIAIVASLALIPGLRASVSPRVNQGSSALWDRKNLARAAVNMVEAKPLFGFGWSEFNRDSGDYFQQAFDYPLTATSAGIHNTPLTYAVDLGLVGATLWALGVLFGVGTALTTRAPPELRPWRTGLLAIASASLVVMNSVPPTAWLNRSIWLFAGVVYSARYVWSATRPEEQGLNGPRFLESAAR
jgi:putative inorganic carbon (HCO3(-)) transporter